MIINESQLLKERLSFLEKLKDLQVGEKMNIFSGHRNYVCIRDSASEYRILPGKGYDTEADKFLKDNNLKLTNRQGIEKFIRWINAKMGYREELDLDDEDSEELEECDDNPDDNVTIDSKRGWK